MPKQSAGLLLYRRSNHRLEVFLVRQTKPYPVNFDLGAWTIPKGEYEAGERPLEAARREFTEETGFPPPASEYLDLGTTKLKSGKVVAAWAAEGDCDPAMLISNTCVIEFPYRSGKKIEIPEVDKGAWFSISEAHKYIRPEQKVFLATLAAHLTH